MADPERMGRATVFFVLPIGTYKALQSLADQTGRTVEQLIGAAIDLIIAAYPVPVSDLSR